MRKLEHANLLLLIIALVAVGQMTQTIYVPVIADMAVYFGEPTGAVQQVMGAYLFSYGFSQLIYGPISDRVGRRPVILVGMSIFCLATIVAIFSQNLTTLVIASTLQGMGTGVAGVMTRTQPRDLYTGTALRYANSLLNMGVLVSPLLAPMIGGVVAHFFGWHACYIFLLLLGGSVLFSMYHWMPETRPVQAERRSMLSSFYLLLSNSTFSAFLIMLICALSGIAVFEASSGVLMGGVLGLNSITISILFILPIPAALFFFGAGMLFPLATTGAMEPFPYLAGAAGALVGGLQNVGSGIATWFSALLPQHNQFSLGMIMFIMSVAIMLCWIPLSHRFSHQQNTV